MFSLLYIFCTQNKTKTYMCVNAMVLSEDKDIFRSITLFDKLMAGNNPDVDLVNGNMYIKFGYILFFYSQDMERKPNSDINQGP